MFSIPVSEKLNRNNFLMWRAQVLPAVQGSCLMGILDGSVVQPTTTIRAAKQGGGDKEVDNPAYRTWIVQDQHHLTWHPGWCVRYSSMPRSIR